MSKIEAELLKATGVKPVKDRQKTLLAIHTAVMKLDDTGWEALGDPAQKWANLVTKAIEKEEALPDFPDVKAAEEEEAEEEAPKNTRAKPAAKEAKPATKEKAEAKKPAAKAEAKEKPAPKKKEPGRIEKMKGIMLKNLSDKPDDLKAKLVAAGIEVSDATVTTVRSDFLSSLRVLKKAGKLEEKLADKIAD